VIWLLGLALAQELPELPPRPGRRPTVEGECVAPMPVGPGATVDCVGVLVPVSEYAELLELESWGRAVHEIAELDRRAWEWERAAHELELARARGGFWRRPGTQRVLGMLEGAALVSLGCAIGGCFSSAD